MKIQKTLLLLLTIASCAPLLAQVPVTGVANPESLFTSADAKLNANKQVVLHIERDLLEANHWSDADKYLTQAYIQHNPNVASGLGPVMKYFGSRTPTPIPSKMTTKVVAVIAEGDLVIVATPRVMTDAKNPGHTYTTTWFDMWRIKNGKADEHWDGATIAAPAMVKKQ